MGLTIGEKIRYFRERAKMTQMELEIAIGAASGSVSKTESGKTEPTKETLVSIERALNLNQREASYLFGPIAQPASEAEMELARAEVATYFSRPDVMGYLVDERTRLIAVSQAFKQFFQIADNDVQKIQGRSLIELIINPDLPVYHIIAPDSRANVLANVLSRLHDEMGFMLGDEVYEQTMQWVRKDPVASEEWRKICEQNTMKIPLKTDRDVAFLLNGQKVAINYTIELLPRFPRFQVVVYN